MPKYFIYRCPVDGYNSNDDYQETEISGPELIVVLLKYDSEACINGTSDVYFRVPSDQYDHYKKTNTFA